MERTVEIPDKYIADLAEQYLDTAKLLLRNIPAVVAPSPLRANAAFAIELFIKSLNSHWVNHSLKDELGFDDAYAITTESSVRGHKLAPLFKTLPESIQNDVSSAFSRHALARNHSSIEELLEMYSDTFETERYRYEHRSVAYESRRPAEIVELAEFFQQYVALLPTRRYAVE